MEYVLIEVHGKDRGHTASWLLVSADEAGIDRNLIRRARNGYLIPKELQDWMAQEAPPAEKPSKLHKSSVEEPAAKEMVAEGAPDHGDDEPDRETVRAWAKENGYEVAERGQLKKAIYEAYAKAHEEN